MTHIRIHTVEVQGILRTKQPREKYEALIFLFNSNFDVSIDSHEAAGSSSDGLEMFSDSSKKLNSSDEFDMLSDRKESDVLSPSNEAATPSVNGNHIKYTYSNAKDEKCTLYFVGGALFKLKSNKGNDRIICVSTNEFSYGCEKNVYCVNWQVSIKADGCNVYKQAPDYVWASFLLTQTQSGAKVPEKINKALEEVSLYKLFYPKTKQLCEIKSTLSKYGFMMPNLGVDLISIATNKDYSEDDRVEIALLLIQEFKYIFEEHEKVHCDLKLDNVCYDLKVKKVNFIDLDGMTSIYNLLEEIPTVTLEYCSQFLFDKEKECDNSELLCLGQYRIMHSLWMLVTTCAQLFYGQQKTKEEYFLDKRKQIDGYFQDLKTADASLLPQEEIITKTKKLAFEFIISFYNDLQSFNSNDKKDIENIEDNSRKRTHTDTFQFWKSDENSSDKKGVKREKGLVILDEVGDPSSSQGFSGPSTAISRLG